MEDRFDDVGEEQERHLQRLQRMAMLGTLAAGLGHDLRNLIMPVLLRLDVLSESKDLPETARADLAGIRVSVAHLQRLAGGLRLLASDPFEQRDEVQITRLAEWWTEVMPLVVDALSPETKVTADFAASLPPVAMPPGTLAQVVVNLVMNARKAMEGTESPALAITSAYVEGIVCVEVTDNGAGMDAETRRRCFEPYFTTRPREYATGLGLSTCRALMQRFGGDVAVSTNSEPGATFSLTLPVHPSAHRDPERAWQPRLVHVSLRDPRQRALVRLMLSQRGMKEWKPGAGAAPPSHVICDAETIDDTLSQHRLEPATAVVRVIAVGTPTARSSPEDVVWIEPTRFSMLADVLQ
ncbi:MAG: HAMP domain-containing histidine kinase [Cytophagaceae bacterium]|nr:HAMP domain-containing histidine kinase [Gemmatimonadaceae bacterium]